MIFAAPNSLEFANSLATSFGNFGVTIGTTLGGLMIVSKGVVYNPWIGLVFGVLAFVIIALRSYLEKGRVLRSKTI